MAVLDAELAAYETLKSQLVSTDENRFALVYGEELMGIFDTAADAIDRGYQTLGNVAFLVKKIERVEHPISVLSVF
jgi:hypothetical protein